MAYSFSSDGKTYSLEPEKCAFFLNDEEKPVEGIDVSGIIDELAQSDMVYFDKVYYDQACENCHKNRKEGAKNFEYLEFHFYLFANDQQYVMSSLSVDYEYRILPDLLDEGVVDGSYIVSINVCPLCGDYTIDLAYGLW